MKPLAQNTLIQNRYLIVHLIGKGGMGEVYLAVDQRLGSAVALKRTFFAGDDMLGNAFEREARTLARMRHPVLPKVSDHFGEGDEQYLVMEHISGDDLAKRLDAAGKPFPLSWVLFWADQLLDALSYLHTHEPPIIHRDIKPQNLKLTDENHIILLDFGLSKTSTGQTNISQSGSTGSVVGYTPHYAPMEQIRGIGTSPRSDLYSLSATLYQLLTNSVPVDALSRADSMLNGMPDPIKPPHSLNPEVPQAVSDVLLRGMEVSQEKRYANAREMQRVLRKAFNDMQQATVANTVAFTADEAEAIGMRSTSSTSAANTGPVDAHPSNLAGASEPGLGDAPAIEPDRGIDLEATMAYGTPEPNGGVMQSSVKTEVFTSGGNSFPPAETDRPDTPVSGTPVSIENSANPFDPPPASEGFAGDATVPFISLDRGDADRETSFHQEEAYTPAPSTPFDVGAQPSADEAETPYHRSAESEPEAAAAAVPYATAAQAPVSAPAKSSGKMIALIGGLAALVLVAALIGGAAWAYMKYGSALTDPEPTPSPSPEETVAPTPSPEPTLESSSGLDTGNSNSGNSSSIDDNSNSGLTVEPVPEQDTDPERPTGVTRPTPRPGQTPRPGGTPSTRPQPTRRSPVARPTVLP